MDCSADTMTNRLLQRSRSSPQADDNTTTIAKRLETYYRASIPVVAYYETKTQLHKVSPLTAPQNEPTTHFFFFFFQKQRKKVGNFRFRDFGIRTALLLLFSRSVVSDSLQPHGLQHARPPCPSPPPGVCSNSCPLSQRCHPTISSSVMLLSSSLQSFPASGSFPMSQFFPSGGQSIGVSASISVLPMNIQD